MASTDKNASSTQNAIAYTVTVVGACLKAWLQKDYEASWEQILHAVEATDKHCHIVSFKIDKVAISYLSIYVIYKPRLTGAFNKYTTQLRRQRRYAIDKPWALRARGLSVASTHNYRRQNASSTQIAVAYIVGSIRAQAPMWALMFASDNTLHRKGSGQMRLLTSNAHQFKIQHH